MGFIRKKVKNPPEFFSWIKNEYVIQVKTYKGLFSIDPHEEEFGQDFEIQGLSEKEMTEIVRILDECLVMDTDEYCPFSYEEEGCPYHKIDGFDDYILAHWSPFWLIKKYRIFYIDDNGVIYSVKKI